MDRWIRRFEARRACRPEFVLPAAAAPPAGELAALARSLAHFQLGESGSGEHLFAAAARLGDATAVPALRLFVAEEQDHARWLAAGLAALGGEPLRRHWSARAFVRLRHLGGARGEMLVLLLAELVGATYYRMLAGAIVPPPLRPMLAQIARDEGVHLAFQVDWHRPVVEALGPLQRRLLHWFVWACFRIVCCFALLEHHRALRPAGGALRFWRVSGALFARVGAGLVRPARGRERTPLPRAAVSSR